MNKKEYFSGTTRSILGIALAGSVFALASSAAPRTGEAVVVNKVGDLRARVFTGSVHDGRTEMKNISEGYALGETSRLITGKNGRSCMALSPGAVLCVAPETELTFRQLRHSADGLPESEDDLVRRIHIELHKGRILLHAGAPTPSLDIRVQTDAGEVDASGGTLAVAQTGKGEWAVFSQEYDHFMTPKNGARVRVPEGDAFRLTLGDDGRGEAENDPDLRDSPLKDFEVCNIYFEDLDAFFQNPLSFDREGVSRYIGAEGGVEFVGSADQVSDVSPSIRQTVRNPVRSAPPPGVRNPAGRWEPQQAWAWYENIGVVKGVNYIPRTAVNSAEMWSEQGFDADLIDEELGWARQAGFTTLRVQLQYAVWKDDPDAFLDRMDQFLDLAEKHDLGMIPVLFDDKNLAGKDPVAGVYPDPLPGQHNARWTPSPGKAAATDRSVWPDLEEYVTSVIDEFKNDDRVTYWDLYNRTGDNGLWEQTLPLMDQTFNWARDVDPDQPLAVAAWGRHESAMSARMLERSDIITFHSFESAEKVEAHLMRLKQYKRPLICSDWLMRQRENTFKKILPLFSVNRIGWVSRGLVKGDTQEWIQQESYRSETDPDLWQHDILHEDGEAYDDEEIRLIQEFRFQDRF